MGLWEWFDGVVRLSNGAVLTGLGAVLAGSLALIGVLISTYKAERRATTDRATADAQHKALEARERETSRHARFSTVVEQLASDQSAVRIGALYTLSALADEWDQEARSRLDAASNPGTRAPGREEFTQEKRLADRKPGGGGRWREPLVREDVDVVAKDAVGQRDACIGLLCAYLRAEPKGNFSAPQRADGRMSRMWPWGSKRVGATENSLSWADDPRSMPDRDARQEATKILRNHTVDDAPYPWPGKAIVLHGAHLENTHLPGMHLERAYLARAHLQRAYLNGTHLEGADLTDAHLEGAYLRRAYLGSEATGNEVLLGSVGYGKEFRAKWSGDQQWPEGFHPREVLERQIRKSRQHYDT